jgi:N-methylhydantoinase B
VTSISAASLAIWNHRLAQICDEMGLALARTALSPNIKERRDFSCALFDRDGRLLAQAAHIPVHLGSTAMAVRAVIDAGIFVNHEHREGVAIVNDPYAGGTHLPDVTLVAPVDDLGWVAVRAHHADVGGAAPGSMPVGVRARGDAIPQSGAPPPAVGARYAEEDEGPMARGADVELRAVTIDDEGVRLPPTLLDEATLARFCDATRSPAERRADLLAQRAAIEVGRARLRALARDARGLGSDGGAEVFRAHAEALVAYGERLMRAAIAAIPDGVYAFADSLDDDGAGGGEVGLRVTLEIRGDEATLDFTECDGAVRGPLNAPAAVTVAAVLYAFRLLLDENAPTNEGLLGPIAILLRPDTLLAAAPPSAVSAGNVETSQRVVDVVLGALAQALPGRIPAASAGTMSNLLLGGEGWAYYETIAGGAGASPAGDGASAIQTHMTNTRNTPVEELERALPVRVVRYAVRRGSGGGGQHRGGDGVYREFELLADAALTLVADRRRRPPYGLAGGGPGLAGEDTVERDGRTVRIPSKIVMRLRRGDRLAIATPGGGGHGDPLRAQFWAAIMPSGGGAP